jgi:LysR family glycine cleavage system transcriptional activator
MFIDAMNARTYPLNALRAFETSARHLSFVRAADELFVTPAAISHQVKRLETYLGVRLFRRLPNGLLLTEAAQRLLADLVEVFRQLDAAVGRIRESRTRGVITLSVAPMFAVKWLLPRLHSFGARHPDIDVLLSSSTEVVDLQRNGFDAAVRVGRGRYAGLETVKLFDETVTPLCSPHLLRGAPLRKPDDLQRFVLLHDDSMKHDSRTPTWTTWLQAAGAMQVKATRGPHFNQPDHALQAAIDGAGIALGWRYLAADDIAAGRLVQPFKLELPLRSAFYFVTPSAAAKPPKVDALREWIVSEIQRAEAA